MKTFEQFIFEATTTERLVRKSAEMIKKYHKDPEKLEVYRTKNQKKLRKQRALGEIL